MLPTKIAKPRVFNIQAVVKRDTKSEKTAFIDAKKEKSFKMKRPSTTPLKSERRTLLVYRAKAIARRDGKTERNEVSMIKTQKLKVLNQVCQIFLYKAHTLFV